MTHAVCGKYDSIKRNAWTYHIERKIQKLAKIKNSYVVALLDCGREQWRLNDTEMAASEMVNNKTKTDAQMNLIISYKCPNNSKVSNAISVPQEYFR